MKYNTQFFMLMNSKLMARKSGNVAFFYCFYKIHFFLFQLEVLREKKVKTCKKMKL